ncbi:phosphotransferase enzyme family protein [Catenulispora yoronensis]|uniref:phosphotransferase enzyme family protein n=1 Tax=Catenulispora yoronensis TaxID=450799 RepID=UPI0031D19C5F
MSVEPEIVAELLSSWGLEGETVISGIDQGTNNQTFLVGRGTERLVLRVSQSLSPAEVQAEHAVLRRVRQAGLPFRVPEPMPALDGETVVKSPAGPASLSPWLPGTRPDLADEPALGRFGRAVGLLDGALARVPLQETVRDWRGDPLRVPGAPAVAALCAELRGSGIGAERTTVLETAARRVARDWPSLLAELPVQVIHGALAADSVLADPRTGEIIGILDFEFAGSGFRVQDFLAALFNSGAWERPDWLAHTSALARGYASARPLEIAEIDAIPTLLLARSVAGVLWRASRWRVARAQLDDVASRLRKLEALTVWLAADREMFQSMMADTNGH